MASTTFVDRQTPIVAAWLNDVNAHVYSTYRVPDAAFDGVTDDYSVVQTAINDLYAAGGGEVVITGPCAIGTTIIIKRGVSLRFVNNSYFQWIGSTSGTCVETDSTDVVQGVSLYDMKINTGSSFTGTAFYIHSAHNLYSNRLVLITTGTTSTAIKMIADSTGGESTITKRNTTACVFDLIVQQGQCGTFMEFDGVTSGYDGTPQVVTLNNFGTIFNDQCAQYGMNFKNWTDNNTFNGMISLTPYANNGIGLQMGSSTSQGVYMNSFNLLAVNTFSTFTGRIGMKVDKSKLTKVHSYYQDPEADGGAFIATAAAESYDITRFVDTDKTIVHYRRLMSAASEGFNSSRIITIADDTAVSTNVAEGGTDENITFVLTISSNNANANGIAWLKCRRSTGSAEISLISGGTNFAVTTGALTGTTGTDTKLTVSAHTNGKYYIENRTGSSVYVTTHIAAWMTTP